MTAAREFTLAELAIVAGAEVWRDAGEVLGTGIGTVPRIAVGLAKLTFEPGLMVTDGEAYLVEEPVPLGPRGDAKPKFAGWMPYARVFDNVWSGRRHALVTPVQVDRWGQSNISCLGDLHKPKVQMLGVRGYPGNSINHTNSFFIPKHGTRTFIEGEVDVVSGVGFKQDRWPEGVRRDHVRMGRIVSDLCVMDFGGPDNAVRVISCHPGVSFDEVQAETGFPILRADDLSETPAPSKEQLAIIRKLDPHDMRAFAIKGNPAGARS